MKFSEYIQYDGLGLAKLVKDKEIHPSELLQVALEHTHKANPKLNAIIIPMYEQAKQRAQQPLRAHLQVFPFWSRTCFRNIKVYPHPMAAMH